MNVENVPEIRSKFSLFVYNTLDNGERLSLSPLMLLSLFVHISQFPVRVKEGGPDQSKPFTRGGEMCYGYVSGYEIVSSCLTFLSLFFLVVNLTVNPKAEAE